MIESPQLRHDRIEDYAFISDCVTGALVSRRGSVDWLYWPRFGSSTCFAALLGDRRHGFWRIGPTSRARVSRCYRQGDIDLGHPLRYCKWVRQADRFHATPIRDIPRDLNSKGISGRVTMSSEMALRFEYGSAKPWVEATDDRTIRANLRSQMVLLRSPAPHRGEDHATVADFTVQAEDCIPLMLSYCPSHQPLGPWLDPQEACARRRRPLLTKGRDPGCTRVSVSETADYVPRVARTEMTARRNLSVAGSV